MRTDASAPISDIDAAAAMKRSSSRVGFPRWTVIFVFACALTLFTLWSLYDSSAATAHAGAWPNEGISSELSMLEEGVGPGYAVAVYDGNAFHDEVHGAVLWALRQFPRLDLRFYRPIPWRFHMEQVLEPFYDQLPADPADFLTDLATDTTIRHVVLTTCDWDGRKLAPNLTAIWDARPEDAKFKVVCLRHWVDEHTTAELAGLAERNGSLSMMVLGDHVVGALERNLERTVQRLESSMAPDGLARVAKISIQTLVPTFPTVGTPDLQHPFFAPRARDPRALSLAVIQSTHWDEQHRAMQGIYDTLEKELSLHPADWGYIRSAQGYLPIPDHSPFELWLIGTTPPAIPASLANVVHWGRGMDYPAFYAALRSADLVLPAFGERRYDLDRCSSTFGVAGTASAPVLVTEEYARAYGWFCPAFGVVRPQGVHEIEYIGMARRGEVKWTGRQEREAELGRCQEAWTARNVEMLAGLLQAD